MEKIVFVCLGNICRSPMAEFVMKNELTKAGLQTKYHIESRATSSWEHGNPIHSGTQLLLKQEKIPFDKEKTSQKISLEDFSAFDQIIAMDHSNVQDLKKMAPADLHYKIKMLLEEDIPDPWYTGDFEETYRLVSKGCQKILAKKE